MITLRPMTEPDLSVVEAWMQQPHVARWWLEGSTLQRELEDCVRSVRGEPAVIGHGLGTQRVAVLVEEIRTELPAAGIIVDPSAANLPSRRVLEHNGFVLVEERFVEGILEAVYRLLPG